MLCCWRWWAEHKGITQQSDGFIPIPPSVPIRKWAASTCGEPHLTHSVCRINSRCFLSRIIIRASLVVQHVEQYSITNLNNAIQKSCCLVYQTWYGGRMKGTRKNPHARALGTPLYRKRVVRSAKSYNRKGDKNDLRQNLERHDPQGRDH
jgi:hypothetical protein